MQRIARAVKSHPVTTQVRYTSKYPRPKPGTSERPPHRFPDPLVNNPNASVQTVQTSHGGNLTLIHRPPPTAPSPFSLISNPTSPLLRPATAGAAPLPPHIRPSAGKLVPPPRASEQAIEEMRKLRASNPQLWTCSKLAKKFGCTNGFVSAVAALPKSQRKAKKKELDGIHEKTKQQWSEKKALVVAIRRKRREFW